MCAVRNHALKDVVDVATNSDVTSSARGRLLVNVGYSNYDKLIQAVVGQYRSATQSEASDAYNIGQLLQH